MKTLIAALLAGMAAGVAAQEAGQRVEGTVTRVSDGDTLWLRVPVSQHNDYIPRFGWLDSHHVWIEVLQRDHRHIELFFANAETGAVRSVLQ